MTLKDVAPKKKGRGAAKPDSDEGLSVETVKKLSEDGRVLDYILILVWSWLVEQIDSSWFKGILAIGRCDTSKEEGTFDRTSWRASIEINSWQLSKGWLYLQLCQFGV